MSDLGRVPNSDLRIPSSGAGEAGAAGALAQLGEHLLCKQGVTGSIPVGSTSGLRPLASGQMSDARCRISDVGCRAGLK